MATAPDALSFFDFLFPKKGQQLHQIDRTVEELANPPVPPPGIATTTAAPVAMTTPVPANGAVLPMVWTQPPQVRSLAALYLASGAPGFIQRVLETHPVRVPAQSTATVTVTVPTGVVWLPMAPLTVAARTHSDLLTATVTVDGDVVTDDYPLAVDATVVVAEETAVSRTIEVVYANTDWTDIVTVITVNAVAWDAVTYQQALLPIIQAAQATVAARAQAVGQQAGGTLQ